MGYCWCRQEKAEGCVLAYPIDDDTTDIYESGKAQRHQQFRSFKHGDADAGRAIR